MKVLSNLVKKNLMMNRHRTIVTIISIVLSCALIGGVSTLVASFQKFMQDIVIESEGNYHATFFDVTDDQAKYIENDSYIKTSMRSTDLGYAYLEGSTNEGKPYLFVTAFDGDKLSNMPLTIIDGRLPKNSSELVISNHIETNGGVKYNVGDTITLNIGNRYLDGAILSQTDAYTLLEDGSSSEALKIQFSKTYMIVGLIDRPSFENYSAPGYTVITYLDEGVSASIYDISVITNSPKNIYEKIEKMASKDPLNLDLDNIEYHGSLLRWYGVTDNDNANSVLYGFAGILIVVIMIASIIVIYNSFNISIVERKKQFGILASIGTTSKQIRKMVYKEGLLLSLIGIPLGIISSIIGIGITLAVVNNLNIFSGYYQSRLTLTVSMWSILVTIVFGGLTIFLSSLIPAFKASKASPIDAIRLSSDIKIKGKKLRTPKWINRLFGVEGQLALKNMKRSRKKYRSTIISLFVSIVLFMTVNAFADYSFRSTLKVYKDYNFDIVINSNTDDEESIDKYETFLKEVSKLEDVDRYSIANSAYLSIPFDEDEINPKALDDLKDYYDVDTQKYIIGISLSVLGDDEFERYTNEINQNSDNYKQVSNPKIILMDKTNFYSLNEGKYYEVKLTDLQKGDKISFVEDDNLSMSVGTITSLYPTGFAESDSYVGGLIGFISNDVYDSLDESLIDGYSEMYIKSSNPTSLLSSIENLGKEKQVDVSVSNISEIIDTLNNMVLAISIFLYGFIILVSLITITNVINTITTSIYLRRREFAMLKAVGMTDKDFNKMIRFESLFYGLKSLLFGLPVGIFTDYLMFKASDSMFVYDYVIPYKPILISITFVFVIISITMMYSVRKIRKDNIVDIIKQENL
ncbi:MAG: FtsX-like permease family protein [Bacilli bacterium]|jgi:putative ABC transport system permease protein